MAGAGVQTLYLQSSRPGSAPSAYGARRSSHGCGMKVVLWCLPRCTNEERDARHMRTAAGEKVDGIDVESTEIRSVAERNRRVVRRRHHAEPDRAGARRAEELVVDVPFAETQPHVDAVASMTYWAYRKGKVDVSPYTGSDLRLARKAGHDARLPVHVIGSPTTAADVRSRATAVDRS